MFLVDGKASSPGVISGQPCAPEHRERASRGRLIGACSLARHFLLPFHANRQDVVHGAQSPRRTERQGRHQQTHRKSRQSTRPETHSNSTIGAGDWACPGCFLLSKCREYACYQGVAIALPEKEWGNLLGPLAARVGDRIEFRTYPSVAVSDTTVKGVGPRRDFS